MPDDGRRYELIDGELLVTPAPGWAHQEAAITLTELLRSACPRDLRVLIAPFAVRPDLHNELQPDVLVARFADLTLKNLPKPPVLAVEVASPSSRLTDANLKGAVYSRTHWPRSASSYARRGRPACRAARMRPRAAVAYRAVVGSLAIRPRDLRVP